MMILFRCSCGAAHQADAQYAGGSLQCPKCGQQAPIPSESDPAVALVYKAGESEDGFPMTLDEIRVQLVAGGLAPSDLIWDGGTWRPLSEVVGSAEGAAKPELKLKRAGAEAGQGDDELAESLDELSPIQKVDLGSVTPAAAVGSSRKGGKGAGGGLLRKLLPRRRSAAEKQQAQAEAAVRRKNRGAVYYTLQVLIALGAVWLGFKYGFGPLISSVRGKPTHVIVQSHEPIEYVAQLGWRRLSQDIYPNSFCKFETYVGMPERQTLRVRPKTSGTGEPIKLRVPVRPGASVLVNLKGLGVYGVYEPWSVRSEKLQSSEVKALTDEIRNNRAPENALKVSRQIRDLVQPAFRGTSENVFFSSRQYLFPGSMATGEGSGTPGSAASDTEARQLPLVVTPPQYRVPFANGYGLHCAAESTGVERGLTLALNELKLNDNHSVKTRNLLLDFRGDDKVLRLTAKPSGSVKVKAEKKTFTGTWDYSASCPLVGAKANQWTWRWLFRGEVTEKGKRYRLELTVDSKGQEKSSVKAQ